MVEKLHLIVRIVISTSMCRLCARKCDLTLTLPIYSILIFIQLLYFTRCFKHFLDANNYFFKKKFSEHFISIHIVVKNDMQIQWKKEKNRKM